MMYGSVERDEALDTVLKLYVLTAPLPKDPSSALWESVNPGG